MPEEENTPKTLHELVSGSSDENGKNKKVVGYSVASYVGVLSALEKAKQIRANGQPTSSEGISYNSTPSSTTTSRSWTFLSNYGISNTTEVENEFFKTDLNQARVILRDYMPFVLDCKNNEGKIERTCVGRRDYICYNFMNQGLTIGSSQNPQFPPGEWSSQSLERCKNGISCTDGNGFVIGLGVAFNQLVINYFKHFYPNMNWEEEKLKKLAAKGYLCGELMVPKGDNAKVLHSKITVDISQSNTSAYDVFVPVPLMLLDDFKELGYVKVRNNGTEENVDGNKLKFPYADKKFNHKKSEIEGFSPDDVKDYVPGSDKRSVEYRYTGLNGGGEVQGRIRFYFMPDGKGDVSSIVGAIPDEYMKKLFSGVLSEDGYYKTVTTTVYETPNFQAGDIYWDPSYFTGTDITREQYEKAVRITWDFEVGKATGDWARCEDIGDTAGISYGPFQYTEGSGLLSQIVAKYLNMKTGKYNEHDEILANTDLKSGSYSGTKYANNVSVCQALKAVGTSQEMKNVQGEMFLQKRVKPAIQCMKETGMKSALAFHIWVYYINHGWSQSYKTKAKNEADEKTKCLALIAAHERRLQNLPPKNLRYKGKIQFMKPWDAYPGWQPMLAAHRKAANGGNFNLDIPQVWRNSTI